MIHYGMTKTAQGTIVRGPGETTAGTGVTVNSVLAGPTALEGVKDFVEQVAVSRKTNSRAAEKEFINSVRSTSLLTRFASPRKSWRWSPWCAVPCLPRPIAPPSRPAVKSCALAPVESVEVEWADNESFALRLGLLQKDDIGIGMAPQNTKTAAIRRPVERKDLLPVEVSDLTPGRAVHWLNPDVVHAILANAVSNCLSVCCKFRCCGDSRIYIQ